MEVGDGLLLDRVHQSVNIRVITRIKTNRLNCRSIIRTLDIVVLKLRNGQSFLKGKGEGTFQFLLLNQRIDIMDIRSAGQFYCISSIKGITYALFRTNQIEVCYCLYHRRRY